LADTPALAGAHVVVTAGGTREPIDPVRFLGNRSSGKMGTALAQAAATAGARVTLITTVDPTAPLDAAIVRVDTAAEMHAAVRAALVDADVLFMAAAVADYRPAAASPAKLKKTNAEWRLALLPTADILTSLRDEPARARVLVVGFAAETEDAIANAQGKLRDKGLDLIVVNDVSRPDIGMGSDDNEVTLIDASGVVVRLERAPKRRIAERIVHIVAERLPR
jgi:phosphopantothenoylcysteine decarboxylase/phosphopantothenate--cysteine ligase